ncbi:MAG: hypothetical protein HFJ46_05280 [Clostridia bacterium]|nr:hypothetical protein [Clostridia bacterium]
MDKNFELSLVLGRFNHIHLGHKYIIDISKKISEKTLILIGSSQESGTLRNPFLVDTRKKLIESIYPKDNSIQIAFLEDMTNEYDVNYEWGRYILEHVKNITGKKPNIMIHGNDESRKGWFDEKEIEDVSEMIITRKDVEISATKLRGYILIGDKRNWCTYVPDEIHEKFEDLREELLNIPIYKKIYDNISSNLTLDNFYGVYNRLEQEDKTRKKDTKK